MVQRLLRLFLIDRVEEYYFTNITVVTLVFLAFHFDELKLFLIGDEGPTETAFYIALGLIFLIFISYVLIKSKDNKDLSEGIEVVSFVPLFILTLVSSVALFMALGDKDNAIETALTAILMIRHGLRLLVLTTFSLMARYGYTNNKFHNAVYTRLQDAMGNYQTSLKEVIAVLTLTILAAVLLTLTSFNPFTEFLLYYFVADTTAKALHKSAILVRFRINVERK